MESINAGMLILPKRKNNNGKDLPYKYISNNYKNENAVQNVINDITRSGKHVVRQADLICYGAVGIGYNLSAEDMVKEMLCVQEHYHISRRKGRRIYHEVFSIEDWAIERLGVNYAVLGKIAYECACVYYQQGFQVVYAVHHQGKYHIHFAVSSINYITGYKFHSSRNDMKMRQACFNSIMTKYIPCNCPVIFESILIAEE